MGKGKAQKRRAKNALRANSSNLHKAQKGKASATIALPQPPTKRDLQDYVPKGLQKLQALKRFAEGSSRVKRRKIDEKPVAEGTNNAQDNAEEAVSQPAGLDAEKYESDNPQAASPRHEPEDAQEAAKQKPAKLRHVGLEAPIPYEEPGKAVNEKKKLYRQQLRQRQKAKKKKGSMTDPEGTGAQQVHLPSSTPKFGEQADAPPQINLKRKHWQNQDPAVRNNERCKQIFLKQLEDAKKKASLMNGAHDAGLAIRNKKLKEHEQQAVRQQVIEAYRQQKRSHGRSGGATQSTLAALVTKGNAA